MTTINPNSVGFKKLEKLMLELLVKGNMQEPEVIKKIAERFTNKQIDIVGTNQGIEFFIKLNSVSPLSLHQILCDNIDYFLQKDGDVVVINTIQNHALILPVDNHAIEQRIEQKLIQELQLIQSDINPNLVSEILISAIRNNSLNEAIDNLIKQEIKNLGNSLEMPICTNLSARNLEDLLSIMKKASFTLQDKKPVFVQNVQQKISSLQFFTEQVTSKEEIIELTNKLVNNLKITQIAQEYIEQCYGELLAIKQEHNDVFYKSIKKYLKWDQVVSDEKINQYQIISQQVIAHDDTLLALTQKDIYYEYILNTLPYRSYANISAILNNNSDIPAKYKQKLQCVMFYCQKLHPSDLGDLGEDDATSLNLFVVQDKNGNNILIYLHDLQYLNNNNVTGFNLEQFKVLKFIHKPNDDQEIETSDLTLKNFREIQFPAYLCDLIESKFVASNIIAKHIYQDIKKIITQYSLNVSTQQEQQLEECCYQVALNPGKEIMIPLTFKQKLIESFEDFNLLISESIDNKTKETVPAGDFMQVRNYLENKKSTVTNTTDFLQLLPKRLVEKSETLKFTNNSDQIINDLFTELNDIPSLKDTVSQFEIAYILGIIFMDMSSIHALGYHSGSDNMAFARFRLLGVYWLSKSICFIDNTWTPEAKSQISQEINNAILTEECSGQIVNKLFGEYCNTELQNIYNKITKILKATLV